MSMILLTVLTPVAVYLATLAAKAIIPLKLSDAVIHIIVVIFTALASWLGTIVSPSTPWEVTLVAGLGATFIHEFLKNFSTTSTP